MTDINGIAQRLGVAAPEKKADFPVVGIGASAGGIDALEELFASLPADTGIGYVVIQHLEAGHDTKLHKILARRSALKIRRVTDNTALAADSVFIIPPGRDLALLHGRLQTMETLSPRHQARPIDFFFRSLARDRRERAIGIILSGTGTDGISGLKEIKAAGGIVICQQPDSAAYPDMPAAAVRTGLVDLVLSPAEIAGHLAVIGAGHPRLAGAGSAEISPDTADYLQKIFVLIRNHTGHDFSGYKEGVVCRRVERRMLLHQIERIGHYVRFLRESDEEIEALFQDLLIGVTSFFRDRESFRTLREKGLAPLMDGRPAAKTLRIWVVGCATGEEAYTIAMLAAEEREKKDWQGKIQIFATDIDHRAVEFARRGVYGADALDKMDPDRLHRFFSRRKEGYLVRKQLRDMVIFAEQNVIRDPPFSRLDLISCRNLLIYMSPDLHALLFPLFYHSLVRNGYLFLGNSENIGSLIEYFRPVVRNRQLYRRQGNLARHYTSWMPGRMTSAATTAPASRERRSTHIPSLSRRNFQLLCEKSLLARHTPAAALINENREVLYCHGPIADFLQLSAGKTRYDILSLVRPHMRHELGRLVTACLAAGQPVESSHLNPEPGAESGLVDLRIEPVGNRRHDRLFLVIFTPVPCSREIISSLEGKRQGQTADSRLVDDLERELQKARDRISFLVEEAAIADLESRSILEELKSSNQELQSANEELETSREELQSTTEELVTVNQELEQRVTELNNLNNDMVNLLAATDIGTVFLDLDLIIQRFTPAVARVINLRPSDEGRPLQDLRIKLDYPALLDDAELVLTTLDPIAREARSPGDNRWYLVQMLPYRTTKGEIQGVVISFIDITWRHQAEEEVKRSRLELEQIFNSAADGMQVILNDYTTILVNDTFLRMTGKDRSEYMSRKCWELFPGSRCKTSRCSLERVLEGEELVNELVTIARPDAEEIDLALTARPFLDTEGRKIGAIMCYRDISDLRQKEEQFHSIFNNAADAILWTDLRTCRIIRCNKAAEKLLGYSQKQLIGMEQSKIHPPEKKEEYRRCFTSPHRKDHIFQDEVELLTSRGEIVHAEVRSSHHDFDGKRVIQGIFRDLSTEKTLQKKLAHQQKMASRYLDIASSLIVAIDRDERITLINRNGSELLGRPREELIGANWFDLCLPESWRKKLRGFFQDLISGKAEPQSGYVNPVLTSHGKEVTIMWFNTLLTDENNKIIGTLSAGNIVQED